MEKPVDRSLIVIDIGGTNIRINHVDCITKTVDNKTEVFPSFLSTDGSGRRIDTFNKRIYRKTPHHAGSCVCGKYGCIEAYSNGHLFFELAQNNNIPIKKIFQLWNSTDKVGRALKTMIHIQALAVNTAAMLFMPEHIIIGGGIVAMQGYPKHYLEEQIKCNALFPDLKPYFSIKWTNLGQRDRKSVV